MGIQLVVAGCCWERLAARATAGGMVRVSVTPPLAPNLPIALKGICQTNSENLKPLRSNNGHQ